VRVGNESIAVVGPGEVIEAFVLALAVSPLPVTPPDRAPWPRARPQNGVGSPGAKTRTSTRTDGRSADRSPSTTHRKHAAETGPPRAVSTCSSACSIAPD
jgi:hypothetical protein